MKDTHLVKTTCDMCHQEIDCCKNSFELRFEEPDPTYGRSRYSTFDFCSPECLAIYALRHFGKNDLGHIEFKR